MAAGGSRVGHEVLVQPMGDRGLQFILNGKKITFPLAQLNVAGYQVCLTKFINSNDFPVSGDVDFVGESFPEGIIDRMSGLGMYRDKLSRVRINGEPILTSEDSKVELALPPNEGAALELKEVDPELLVHSDLTSEDSEVELALPATEGAAVELKEVDLERLVHSDLVVRFPNEFINSSLILPRSTTVEEGKSALMVDIGRGVTIAGSDIGDKEELIGALSLTDEKKELLFHSYHQSLARVADPLSLLFMSMRIIAGMPRSESRTTNILS